MRFLRVVRKSLSQVFLCSKIRGGDERQPRALTPSRVTTAGAAANTRTVFFTFSVNAPGKNYYVCRSLRFPTEHCDQWTARDYWDTVSWPWKWSLLSRRLSGGLGIRLSKKAACKTDLG